MTPTRKLVHTEVIPIRWGDLCAREREGRMG